MILQDVVTLYARLDLPSTITDGIKKVAKAHETQFSYVVGIAISLAIFKNSTNREIAKAVILPGAPSDTRFRLPEDKRRTHIANGLVAAGSMIVPTSALKVNTPFSILPLSQKLMHVATCNRKLKKSLQEAVSCRRCTGKPSTS